MSWAEPRFFLVGLIVPLVVAVGMLAWRWRQAAIAALGSVEALDRLIPRGARRARAWQAVLAVLAAVGLAIAAPGPRYGFDWVQRKAEGVALVVVLDVSRSMDATDLSPSRMVRAKREVADLVGELRGDTVGLVLVANGAYVRMPLTADYGTLLWALDDSGPDTIVAQGTAMAGGIDAAIQMLTRNPGAGKGIVVVSDGEFHDSDDALAAAAARAAEAEIRIFAMGVGDTDGAPIPLAEGGFKKDAQGNLVLTRLDEGRLRGLAAATGGAYVRAVVGNGDTRGLYRDEIRAKLTASEHDVRRDKQWHEYFQVPLSVALVAMVLHGVAGIGPRRRVPRAAPVSPAVGALLLLLVALPVQAAPRDEGLSAWRGKDWNKAVELLAQARVVDPDDLQVGSALAESLYRLGRYREAEQIFDSLAAADGDHRALHSYNAGNAAYRSGRLDEAVERFAAAASADPNFEAALRNGEAVRKEIALREQAAEQEQDPASGQQPGEPADGQSGDPQGGQQQDGEAQTGKQNGGQQADGERQGGSQQAVQRPDGPQEGAPQADGEVPAQGEDGEAGEGAARDDAGIREEDGSESGAPAVESSESGDQMTEAEAARLVDGVKEGRPRVTVAGRGTDKDW